MDDAGGSGEGIMIESTWYIEEVTWVEFDFLECGSFLFFVVFAGKRFESGVVDGIWIESFIDLPDFGAFKVDGEDVVSIEV